MKGVFMTHLPLPIIPFLLLLIIFLLIALPKVNHIKMIPPLFQLLLIILQLVLLLLLLILMLVQKLIHFPVLIGGV
jgi:hypothetical protein